MPIIKLKDQNFVEKKVKMIISGFPGIGKTTLALSAPKPLLIDLDKGLHRVEKQYRKDVLYADDYEQLKKDLSDKDNLADYETLIFDTGARLLDLMKPYIGKTVDKSLKKDGSLTLQGYGAVGQEYKRFIDFLDTLNKHIIFIFHTVEEKDGDDTKLRIMIEGQTKNNIWQSMDLGGFVEMIGKKRTIGFTNCERYYAKSCYGIKGVLEIPDLKNGEPNNFLTLLFEQVKENIKEEDSTYLEQKEQYESIMKFANNINEAKNAEDLNKCMVYIKEAKHALTSEKELKHLFGKKVSELGDKVKFDKQKGLYV